MEPFARGYYGGTAGYFAFSGEVDTGIIIRTAHIRGNALTYYSGATLLIDCDPAFELRETQIKAQAFMDLFARD
jgi:anthranilate/para-aminobenzoate synthase component I